jgi:hypothetical protein
MATAKNCATRAPVCGAYLRLSTTYQQRIADGRLTRAV